MARSQAEEGASPANGMRALLSLPSTRLGRWSAGLLVTGVIMFVVNMTVFMPSAIVIPWRQTVLPFYGIAMVLVGLSAGIVGLIAVLRARERSWVAFLSILLTANVLMFVLGEFLVPH